MTPNPDAARRTWIPGPGGWVIAVVIGAHFCAFALVIPGLGYDDPLTAVGIVLVYAPLVSMPVCLYGLPVSIATAALVQLACRRTHLLGVHVFATGVVAGVLGGLWLKLTLVEEITPVDGPWAHLPAIAGLVGVSAGVGRWSASRWIRVR